MDKLAAMNAFVTIVDEGSLTAAADALDKAPPTMVRSLAALEQSLGVRLLTRTTRRMTLTEEGRVYLDRCRKILADVDEAELVVNASKVEPTGGVRITAPVLFGSWHVAPPVAQFVKRFPNVRVDLLLLDRVVDLVEEGIDLGVRIGRLSDSSMMAIPVGQMRRVVVASPDLLRRGKVPRHPHDLRERPVVRHHGGGQGDRWRFVENERNVDVRIRSRFASNVATAAVEACVGGLGFGRFLRYQVEPELRAKRLRIVLAEFEEPPLPIQIVYPDARLMSSRLRAIIDELRDDLRKKFARA